VWKSLLYGVPVIEFLALFLHILDAFGIIAEAKTAKEKTMFALVTGANGLLGRHLVEELLRRGHRVRVLDLRGSTAPQDEIVRSQNLETVRGDVRNSETARTACKNVDVVFHLAALLPQSKASLENMRSVNVRGTETMLDRKSVV